MDIVERQVEELLRLADIDKALIEEIVARFHEIDAPKSVGKTTHTHHVLGVQSDDSKQYFLCDVKLNF